MDRELHKGVCLTMCIDYIHNKRNNLPCDFIFFTKTYKFTSRQRALSYGTTSGKINDAVLSPNGKFKTRFNLFLPTPLSHAKITSCLLNKGDYIITIYGINGAGHSIALCNNKKIKLFDPNKGLFVLDYISELVFYINKNYGIQSIYIYKCL